MIRKSTFIRAVSLLSAVIIVAVGFAVKEKSRNQKYMLMLQNEYTRSFEQLDSSLNNISVSLEKAVYVSSAKKMGALSTEIFGEAELAKSALSNLPTGENGLSTVYRFLSQAGNYALSVAKSITSENGVSATRRQDLKSLSDTAKKISEVINDSNIEHNTPTAWAKAVESRLNNEISSENLAASLTELEEDLSDYPTLIYDGPYSDHILNKQPLMTANATPFSEGEALQMAEKVSGSTNLKFEEIQKGKIECYRFSNSNTNISISKAGGYAVYMRKNREVGENKLSYEQAISAAKEFLENIEIKSLIETYYFTDGGVCVINFAYLDGQTICYTDLIKVGVAMDNGEIMLLETTGYLTNHTDRAFEVPTHTVEEAMESINQELEIEKTAVALIPTDGGGEVRCYEFLCRTEKEQEILIYLNVKTLEEEQLYILLKTDGGTLVK